MTHEQKTAFTNLKELHEKEVLSTASLAAHLGIGMRQVQLSIPANRFWHTFDDGRSPHVAGNTRQSCVHCTVQT